MKYSLDDMVKKTGKKKQDIMAVITPLQIKSKKGRYTEEDFKLIDDLLKANKMKLADHVRTIIERHPFCTEQDLPRLTGRPTSYIRWLLPHLTEEDTDLAETDRGELFYITVENLRTLLQKGEIDIDEFWFAMHEYGLEG